MIKKYGQNRVEFLHAMSKQLAKWQDYELQAMIDDYKKRVKELNAKQTVE
jgi:hypothetical protein